MPQEKLRPGKCLIRSVRDLRGALRLAPDDSYIPEFLGTIYLLEGNLEAALKYWNRLEKPRLTAVEVAPRSAGSGRAVPGIGLEPFSWAFAGCIVFRRLPISQALSTECCVRGVVASRSKVLRLAGFPEVLL